VSGWTKLFSGIVTSSVWCEDHVTVRVWIALLALADADGVVEGSVPGFASLCRVSVPEMETALDKFRAPDPHSRTPDNNGRRIEAIEGGWRVLNYASYRARGQDKDGSRAPYYRAYRRRRRTPAQHVAQQETQQELLRETQKREARSEKREARRTNERTESARSVASLGRPEGNGGNGRQGMSEATQTAIEAAAAELGRLVPQVAPEAWIGRASRTDKGACFSDPTRRGLSEEWGAATLARLQGFLTDVRREPRL
jgi:hypothetical protein